MIELHVRAPNSQLFVRDQATADIAVLVSGGGVDATSGSITISTLNDQDGETTVRVYILGEEPPWHPDEDLMFDGEIETPSLQLTIENVHIEAYFETPVAARTHVTVWTNHPVEPDEIDIVIV